MMSNNRASHRARRQNGRVWQSLRFTAYGKLHTPPLGLVTEAQAARELGFVMSDVARGSWLPLAPERARLARADRPRFPA